MRHTRCALLPLACCLLALLAPADGLSQPCNSLPARRTVELDSTGVFQFLGSGASCWGYQAPDGHLYAIMGGGRSIGFVDVATMTVVDTVETQFCQWRELKTYRNYCYAVSECTGFRAGMMIIDMRYLPDSVHYVGSYFITSNVRSHCISIDTARGYCYLVRQNYSGFRIVSLANPEVPVDVGGVTTGDLHDMTAFNDTVYAAEGHNSAFSIWDCTNKSNPAMLARVVIPGDGYVHNLWPTDDRRFLASTEELPDFRTMKIWNTEDLQSIHLVSEYLGPGGIPHNAHIAGRYLFLAHYSSGISVLDITYPQCPVEVARFDTYQANDNPDFVGCWGVYPYTPNSSKVYASNIDGRFYILDFTVHPFAASATFDAAPVAGPVPLTVNFNSTGEDLVSWHWEFGDGDSAAVMSPSHVYAQPGVYDVSLAVAGPSSADTLARPSYVLALAESALVRDTSFDRSTSVTWDIDLHNNVPISEMTLPVTVSNVPGMVTFDSLSVVGCRTEYFELRSTLYDGRSGGQLAVRLRANFGGPAADLPPGKGPIARVFLTVKQTAIPGTPIGLTMNPIGVHSLTATSGTTLFPLTTDSAGALIGPPCDCSCHADPVCDAEVSISDVITTIGVAFRGDAPTIDAPCPHAGRTDVNCDAPTNVVDVILMINVAFRGEDQASVFCNPCN